MKKLGLNELRAVEREANATLAGARLAKFFETAPGVFRLKFNSRERGEANVLIDLDAGAFLAQRVPPSPEKPSTFAAAVRSRIDNAALRGVSLVNNDRILRFDFEKRERLAIVFEFVGRGNALLLNEENEIVFVWKRAEYSARRLAPHEKYSPPPAGGKPPSPESEAPRSRAEIEEEYWAEAAKPAAARAENRELKALEKSLEAQRAALPALEEEEKKALAAGMWIRENRETAEEILATAKSGSEPAPALRKVKAKKSGAFVEFEAG